MSNTTPSDILENIYQEALGNLSKSAVKSASVREKIEFICRCNANKAPIRLQKLKETILIRADFMMRNLLSC